MFRARLLSILAILGVASAGAEPVRASAPCGTACLLETIWEQAERLEPQQQEQIKPLLLEVAALSGDDVTLKRWEARTGQGYVAPEPFENYSLEKVRKFVDAEGWDEFFLRAKSRAHPMNSGRPEMMAAAAHHLADDQTAARIYALMEELGRADRSQAAFERASFGHALVEAAMHRCDIELFDRALEMTDAPGSIRYAVWRTRMTGDVETLRSRIIDDFDPSSPSILRLALSGYADILRAGECDAGSPLKR